VDGAVGFIGWMENMTDEEIADLRKKISETSQEIFESKAHFKDIPKGGAALIHKEEDRAKLEQLEKDYAALLKQLTDALVK
jgi:hypothetical protein